MPALPLLTPCVVLGYFVHARLARNFVLDVCWAVSLWIETVCWLIQFYSGARHGELCSRLTSLLTYFYAVQKYTGALTPGIFRLLSFEFRGH